MALDHLVKAEIRSDFSCEAMGLGSSLNRNEARQEAFSSEAIPCSRVTLPT